MLELPARKMRVDDRKMCLDPVARTQRPHTDVRRE